MLVKRTRERRSASSVWVRMRTDLVCNHSWQLADTMVLLLEDKLPLKLCCEDRIVMMGGSGPGGHLTLLSLSLPC